ncbi:MAG: ROK family protein [Cellulosilyticaceae bacterium]
MQNKKISKIEIKKMNHSNVFRFIYKNGEVAKQDIAYALDMSLPTITQNLKELQENGLITETGVFESTGGRKAKALAINKNAKFSIGVDITKNHVGIVCVNFNGEIIKSVRLRYVFENTDEYFIGFSSLIENFIENSHIDRAKILGIGIAVPAILSSDKKTLTYSRILDFEGGTLSSFTKVLPYQCILCNDANAAGFAELWNTETEKNVVYLSLNNSVGGSIVINQNLYYGENQRGAECGHMTIVPNGKLCYCGQRGCADAYLNSNILADNSGGNIRDFFQSLREGNPQYNIIWNEYLENLSVTVNNLRMLFDCHVIVGGYVGSYMDEYIDILQNRVAKRNTFETNGNYVKVCRYKHETTAVGAALMHIDAFIKQI